LPKAGKYEFPFFDLDATLEKLGKVHDTLRMDEMNRDVVANTLGMSMTGGGFAYLVSSMEKYGLVKTGGGKLIITEQGKLALYGNESEKEKMRSQAVLSVELFNELFSQYGRDVTIEQIKAFLRQKGNVPVEKAQKLAEKVDKIYKNVANYITTADKLERPEEATPPLEMKQETEPPSLVGGRFETQTNVEKKDLLKIQLGSMYLEVEKNDLQAAELAIQMVAQKLGLKVIIEKSD
jgi:hypothetical protein